MGVINSVGKCDSEGRDLLPKMPHFPPLGIRSTLSILEMFPGTPLGKVLNRIFPYQYVTGIKRV